MGTGTHTCIRFARTVISAVGVILAVMISGFVLESSSGWTSTEMALIRQVNKAHTPQLDSVALGINWLFEPAAAGLLVLLVTGVILLVTRRPRTAIHFFLIVIIPTLGAEAMKLLVHRPRPDIPSLTHILVLEPGGLSFPSGHTSFAACFVLGFVVLTAGRRYRPVLIGASTIVVLGTAASRVYLGVHYPSDVVASIVYSMAAVALTDAVWNLSLSHWIDRRSGVHAGPEYEGAADAR
ncbi:phosphatase PAP2 family protein [Cryobacterium sp. MLB-32]|uniref:phosphatase PAP2 family protein n=1 Tax=Cryobacterium sp. MLB-32 TaxID=1529318 RepID=UPI000692279A|nr:phosphatase PAP2 family protein [Cryobacterium sp. MLB-32]